MSLILPEPKLACSATFRSSAFAVAWQGSGLIMANQINLFYVPQPPDIRCSEGDHNEPHG
jgi:hypothetical protein